MHQLPNRVSHDTLKLERGFVIGTPLNLEFNIAMSSMQLQPGNVMLTLLDENGVPKAAWQYLKTYPLSWSVSDLDANSNEVMIDNMELAYERFLTLRV
jgi:phage tail-like protein